MMVGYCQTYRLRYQQDVQQISALQAIIKEHPLPSDTTFVPIKVDFQILSKPQENPTTLDRSMMSVFEVSWAGEGALRMANKRPDIEFITAHHWQPSLRFGLAPAEDNTERMLLVGDTKVPLDKALIFTIRNGQAILLSPLLITGSDGQIQQTVELPLVQSYKTRGASVEAIRVPSMS